MVRPSTEDVRRPVRPPRDARETLAALLEQEGHAVASCEDGGQALDQFDHLRPDVAIVDIGLPGVDG